MKSKRKPSGGVLRTKRRCDKKLAWKGGPFYGAEVAESGEESRNKQFRKIGGGSNRVKLVVAATASVSEAGSNKFQNAKILNVIDNPANPHFTRRNLIIKSALIEVELSGKKRLAKVTSKPGATGIVSAVLLSEKEVQEYEAVKAEATKKKKTARKDKKPAKKEPKEEKPAEENEDESKSE